MVSTVKRENVTAKKLICLLIAVALILGIVFFPSSNKTSAAADGDEFRGVWVATVSRINYPSNATTNPETLKADAIKILDNAKDMGLNAVFFQVRPASDSFYPSEIFPWSRYLTGTAGQAPADGFDPLAFFIEEAHNRGLELHAWLNPYRITAAEADNSNLPAGHPALAHPEWTVTHTDGKMYWNPGEPGAQQLIADGVKEIVDNYDVDGIHIDDYFYPDANFNDSATYAAYGSDYSAIGDWRRANTETTVKNMYDIVHNSGKEMVFGVSPMGIWCNKSSSTYGSDTKGGEAYTQKFADTRGWVKREIVDYIAPQIYWNIGYSIADYSILLDWWSDVVKDTNVKLYIGQAAYRAGNSDSSSPWYGVSEIDRQVTLNRSNPQVGGYIMYSYSSLAGYPELYTLVKKLNSDNTGETSGTENGGTQEPNEPGETSPTFSDIQNHWAYDYIIAMAEAGIILGDTEGRAMPDNEIKRGDFVLMLLRMLEVEVKTGATDNFIDVKADAYYSDGLATAKAMGLISGIGDNMFAPDSPVTRQDMFVMTFRALEKMDRIEAADDLSVLGQFSDVDKIAQYGEEPLAAFVEKGIVSGMDGELNPLGTATRAQTATVLYQIIQSEDKE